jgi:uncharacterized protein (DUF1015 family)
MAEIAPFRGLRYNLDKVQAMSKVVTPPYDVISPREQELFHEASPYNMVHLELGKATPQDFEENNPHTRAAHYLRKWQEEEALVHDSEPAIYYYELEYSLTPERRQKRYGFICLLRLEDFRTGSVRPHERTFQAVKDERLRLMLACDANLSPVFALYADPEQVIDERLKTEAQSLPALHFRDERGMEHRLWPVKDMSILKKVRDFLLDRQIFIADGHHRYETALTYRTLQRERFPGMSPRAPFEYIMVYLANMNQEGLAILPTHRLLRRLESWEPHSFLQKAERFFDISSYEASEAGETVWRQELDSGSARKEVAIGFYYQGSERLYLLKPRKKESSAFLFDLGFPSVFHQLDVVVLDQLILRHSLDLSDEFLTNDKNILFNHDLTEALSKIRTGSCEAGFLINPTRMEQVQEVAGAGLVMPHKSTYFYPKVLSGLAIHHPLTGKQEVVW